MAEKTFTTDYSEFNNSVNKLLKLGEVRRRDIQKVFSSASRPTISSAKSGAGRSFEGVVFSRYESRKHPSGTLRSSIVFRTSKTQRLVYYVIAKAWYSQIVIVGSKGGILGRIKRRGGGYTTVNPKPKAAHFPGFGWATKWKGFPAKPFMERAIKSTEGSVKSSIEKGMFSLIQKDWGHG